MSGASEGNKPPRDPRELPEPLEANPTPKWTEPEFQPEKAAPRRPELKALGPAPLTMALVLFGLCLALFLRSAAGDFVDLDDHIYVLENPMVNQGLTLEGITRAFTTQHSANWHPLTWISHALDVQLFGLEPAGHHLTSVLLHALTALLFLRLLLLLFDDRWLAISAALLWALHPLRVESVSWVSERKDVLSGLFAMLTLIGYVGWTYFPSRGRKLLVAIVFAAGLMAKPMLVSLPLVMLVLDAWPLKRLSRTNWLRRLKEKTGFVLLALAVVVGTLLTQSSEGAISGSEQLSLLLRLENAQVSLFIYLKQFLWPGTLSALYPHLSNTHSDAQELLLLPALLSLLFFAGLAALALHGRKRFPWLAVGVLWFVVMLLPVLGLVQVGYHAHADRYTYLPSMGLAIIAGSLFSRAQARAPKWAPVGLGLVLSFACLKTWTQIGVWKNSVSLWESVLAENDENLVAQKALAKALREAGDLEGAIEHYRLAFQMDERDTSLLDYVGAMQLELGSAQAAVETFSQARRIDPGSADHALNLGSALMELGRATGNGALLRRAAAQYGDAIQLAPTLGDQLHCMEALAGLQVVQEDLAGAIQTYRQMLDLHAEDPYTNYNLGNALQLAGQEAAARQAFARALEIDPNFQAAKQRLEQLERSE